MPTPSSSSLACTVNGRAVAVDVMPHSLLLDVLREQLGLKGAKRSCDIQVCGACTVLVDGAPVSACTYLAVEAEGREIRTVEGLADGDTLHAVQTAFIEHGAVQCGFCTSGMLLSAAALLEENPSPTREQILHYLRGNLCRCTGYQKIIDAITSCARGQVSHSNIGRETTVPADREPVSNCRNVRPDPESLRVVGQSVRRVDAPEKVTGRARYVTDMELPGTLHAKLLRSPYPHAKILRVDVARARAAPGVRAVVTSADLDWCDPYYGPAFRDRPILAIEVARYEGEPVAAVVAESESAAAQALELIEIAYEELPAVTTLEGALARMIGRPVRLALSVEEAFRTVRRCDASARVRLGFKRDGTLWAAECRADFDVGAYADIGPRIIQKGTYTATGPYRVPNIVLDAKAVYTNTTPGGAFRGFGVPQLAWALESLVDEAARDLGHDPVDLRRQNLLGQGEEFAPGDTPIDGKFEESLNRAAEAIRWTQQTLPGRGRGLAMMMKASVAPTVSEAIVRLHADASVTVLASTVEMGQGARTVMAQIAAEVLAVPVERIFVAMPDTAITPYDQTTSSSRSTTMTGKAVQEAAADVREQLLRIAGRHLGVDATALRLEDAAVISAGARLPYPELLVERFGMSGGELIGRGIVAPGRSAAPLGGSTPFWEMAVGAAEVSVDEETGAVTVHSYASVADVGRCINPQQCEGQDEGAVMQGIGHTLLEEMLYEGGQLLNANLVDYRVPRAEDVPGELQCRFVENGDGAGPFGAKGAGEGSLVPVSPAVGNALARLTGVRFRKLPLTPERVWRALRERQVTRSRES